MLIRMNLLFLIVPDFNDPAWLSPRRVVPEAKHHIRCPFKKADISFPTHPTFTMLESNKLLLHFTPTARTNLVVLSHGLQIKAVRIQQKIHDAHNNNTFFIAPQLNSILHNNDLFERIVNANQRILFLLHLFLVRNCKC